MRLFRPTWKDKTGTRVTGGKWSVQFGHQGKTYKRPLHTRDKRVAQMKAMKLIEEVERAAAGMIDPFQAHRDRPLKEHIEEFIAHLATKDVSEAHHKDRALSLRQYLGATQAKNLGAIDPVEAQRWLSDLAERLSARSVNKRYQALRQFGSWIVRSRRLGYHPYEGITRRNEATDRRRDRRAITHEEEARLLEVARNRPLEEARRLRVRAGVSDKERQRLHIVGDVRAFLYTFALGTGLRRGELGGLQWADIDQRQCALTVRATISKRKRKEELPLRADLAQGLGAHRLRLDARGLGTGPHDLVFPGPLFPQNRTFRADLDGAGLAGKDDLGRVVDFHSLRVTFITRLLVAGVPPRTVQALARHSKIDLTMRVYTDVRLLNLRAAVEATPQLSRAGTAGDSRDTLSA